MNDFKMYELLNLIVIIIMLFLFIYCGFFNYCAQNFADFLTECFN